MLMAIMYISQALQNLLAQRYNSVTIFAQCIIFQYIFFMANTVFTWLNAAATITLVATIDSATIQIRPLLIAQKRSLCNYFYNRLWPTQVRRLTKSIR